MSTSTSLEILGFIKAKSHDGLADVAMAIKIRFTATNSISGKSTFREKLVVLPEPDPSVFVSFEDLSREEMDLWLYTTNAEMVREETIQVMLDLDTDEYVLENPWA